MARACGALVAALLPAPAAHGSCGSALCMADTSWDYTLGGRWAPAAVLPAVHNRSGARLNEQRDVGRVGDLHVLDRYQLHSEDSPGALLRLYGANPGLKVPSGETNVREATGARAGRTLQPGSGTTHVIVGGYYSAPLGEHGASWFVQALYQAPLDASQNYRPGKRVSVDLGYRYEYSDRTGLMLQLNTLHRGRDGGSRAEPGDTGGQLVYLSPGLSYSLARGVQMYGFLRKPVYEYVNGVQLTARYAGVVGLILRY